MRKARLTWQGAYHHVMNRGINDLMIFDNGQLKQKFLSFVSEFSKKYSIEIFAYCIMDNHYHLILHNLSGMLSRFMQALNGAYGTYYRKISQSNGYVFQSRFKSTLIESDSYLISSIIYTLTNPCRRKMVSTPFEYHWSSIHLYFRAHKESFVNTQYVNELIQTPNNFNFLLQKQGMSEIEVSRTPVGDIYGSEKLIFSIMKGNNIHSKESDTVDFSGFQTPEKTICDFEKEYGIELKKINPKKMIGNKIRRKLLRMLREKSLMKYSEIAQLPLFLNSNLNTLRTMYKKSKSE